MRTPIDRIFKNTAEIEPRAVLHLFGALRLDEPAEVKQLDREIGLEAVHLDHLYEVHTPDWHGLHHLEFQTRYESDVPERIADYDQQAYLRYKLPVHTSLILPVEKHVPARMPDSFHIKAGGLTIDCQYRVIRMWELDPGEIFALNRPSLLAFIPLASRDPRDWNRAAKEIVDSGNRSLASTFMTLGGMRYDRSELKGLLEKVLLEELLKPDWIRHSSVVEPLIEQAGRQGREEGREEGRIEQTQRILALLIQARFPRLPVPMAVQRLTDPNVIEDLITAISIAPSPAKAKSAMLRAAGRARGNVQSYVESRQNPINK